MHQYLISIITSENSISVLSSIYKLVSVMMHFGCVTVTVLLLNAVLVSDCRDKLSKAEGAAWSVQLYVTCRH